MAFQSGNSSASPLGSITAPDRICAPTSEPFSTSATVRSAESCFSRIAAASPAGPPPTMTTSYSMLSRVTGSLMGFFLHLSAPGYSLEDRCMGEDTVSTLQWLVEAGAGEAIGEAPVNRLVAAPAAPARAA